MPSLEMSTPVLQVDSQQNAAHAVEQAVRCLDGGGLVAMATETVYGVGARADIETAITRLRDLKDRPERPFSVHVGEASDVDRYVRDVPATARRLIEAAFPGPVTVLLETGGRLADSELDNETLRVRLCWEGHIGLRCPDEPVTAEILRRCGGPVVMPSANLAGQSSPRNATAVRDALDGRVDLLLDQGPTRLGTDSTIVKFSGESWQVVREGALDSRQIARLAARRLLFVCSGNTCRSPMAAALARKRLCEKLSCRPAELCEHGWRVESAGLSAHPGAAATGEAVRAVGRLGAEIASHRARPLDEDFLRGADLICCMTAGHLEAVRQRYPEAAERAVLLAEGDIEDPIGGGMDTYLRAAAEIDQALQDLLEKRMP
jgi:protein-tyrosine phosphatase